MKSLFPKSDDPSEKPHNVIKLNITQLFLTNLSLQYEYGFHKNMSVALGVSSFLPRPLPGLFSNDDPSGEGIRNASFGGFAITPEFRFYPGAKEKHKAPHGFYLGAYMRYARYKLTSQYYDNYNSGSGGNQTFGYNMTMTYGGATIGMLIGSQWLIGKHFSIDWWIIGGGIGKAKFSMDAQGVGINLSPAEQADVKAALEKDFAAATYLHASAPVIETTSNSVKASVSGLPMTSVRGLIVLGLCLGFAF